MRTDATDLENNRLRGYDLSNYPWYHERHRIFPEVFGKNQYRKILDIAAGIGIVGKRVQDRYRGLIVCNDISAESLESLRKNELDAVSFDLDAPGRYFPFSDGSFDAVISLATIEHIINLDDHMSEIWRVLASTGHLYISAPNYSGIHFVIPYLLKGKSFHDPSQGDLARYEFYAHVRYFTYKTLLEFVSSFGFKPVAVYLPLPDSSSRFLALKRKSRVLASTFRLLVFSGYKLLTPRWAFHPVLLFSKSDVKQVGKGKKPKKVIL